MLGTAGCLTIAAEAGRRCRLSTQIAKAAASLHALNILGNASVLRKDTEEQFTAFRYQRRRLPTVD